MSNSEAEQIKKAAIEEYHTHRATQSQDYVVNHAIDHMIDSVQESPYVNELYKETLQNALGRTEPLNDHDEAFWNVATAFWATLFARASATFYSIESILERSSSSSATPTKN